ncbi:MAG: hypothetical protein COA78_29375 [Blastopirellula sp.]|nr:MAG: hypothetical protein COA78_29375 [Blastopirellula sp.]
MDVILKLVRHSAFAPIGVFVFCILPWCLNLLLFYPDERHYIDSSMLMMQNGEYSLPQYDDGSPRLIKPLGTYWIVIASFQLLGTHVVAARLPFLIAGIGFLVATYQITILLTKNNMQAARMSVWILLVNPMFLLSTMRCMPDILFASCLAAAMLGYCQLKFGEKPRASSVWLLALGLGIAVTIKGLPVLLMGGCFFLHFLITLPRPLPKLKAWHATAGVIGLIIAVTGFLPMYLAQGEAVVNAVVGDQVSDRFSVFTGGLFKRLAMLTGISLAIALPWLVPSIIQLFKRKPAEKHLETGTTQKPSGWMSYLAAHSEIVFALLVIGIWTAVCSATSNSSIRYLVPTLPLQAALLGYIISRVDPGILRVYGKLCLAVSQVLFTLVAVLVIVVLLQYERDILFYSLIYVSLGIAFAFTTWLVKKDDCGLRLLRRSVATYLGMSGLLFGFASAAYLPEFGRQVAESVRNMDQPLAELAVDGSASQVSRVRIALPEVRVRKANDQDKQQLGYPLVRVKKEGEIDDNRLLVARCLDRIDEDEAVAAFWKGELGDFVTASKSNYYLYLPNKN